MSDSSFERYLDEQSARAADSSSYNKIEALLEKIEADRAKEAERQIEALNKFHQEVAKKNQYKAEHPVLSALDEAAEYSPYIFAVVLFVVMTVAFARFVKKHYKSKIESAIAISRSVPEKTADFVESLHKNIEERKVRRIVKDETIRQIAREEVSKLDGEEVEALRKQISRCLEEGKTGEAKHLFSILEKLEKP